MAALGDETVSERYKRRVHAALLGHQERLNRESEPKTKGPSRYSTQYAVDWGKAQGWKVLDREHYDSRLKRHHDLLLGSDVMFDAGDGVVLVQGAGQGERALHRRRFEDAGGEDKARRLAMRFVYVEFVRGVPSPVREERWA